MSQSIEIPYVQFSDAHDINTNSTVEPIVCKPGNVDNRLLLSCIQRNNDSLCLSNLSFDSILKETINLTYGWIFVASLFCFFDSCSWYIWVLYARSLGQHNHHIIAVTVYVCYFTQGIATLFWSRISDKYTYSSIAIFLCFMLCVSFFIQGFAQTYNELLIGTGILSLCRSLFACSTAFIAKYLPLQYSIKYTSYLYAMTTVLYIAGPVGGGLISYFINYRSCFITSCIVSAITLLFIIFILYKNEKKIRLKQLHFSSNNTENIQFPICITKNNSNDTSFWNSISGSNWFLLFCIIFANSSLYSIEAILATFYTVFCYDLYPNNKHIIIIATSQVAVYCVSFIIGVRCVPKLLSYCKKKKKKKNVNNYNFNFEHGMLIFTQLIMIFIFAFVWNISNLTLHWILNGIGGLIMGIVNMFQESIILTLQPNKYAGTIAGIKQFGRFTMKAIACLLVGVLWKSDIYYYTYIQSILYAVSLTCTLLMIITEICIRQKNK